MVMRFCPDAFDLCNICPFDIKNVLNPLNYLSILAGQ